MTRCPAPDKFPLRLHATGQWTKKIRGRSHYFGTEKDKALAEYVRTREDLERGRLPRPRDEDALTVAELCNNFLHARRRDVDSGELSTRQWDEYKRTAEALTTQFGRTRAVADLRAEDFGKLRAKLSKRFGVYALAKFVQMARTVFKFGFDNDLIPVPVRYGSQFEKPPVRLARIRRASGAAHFLEPEDCWKLLDAAPVPMRAMLLLALNGGFGPTDVAGIERADLDRRPGWLDLARRKTGIPRRVPLWPETLDALAAARIVRPEPKEIADADAAFLTREGRRWIRYDTSKTDSIGQAFKKLANGCGVKVSGFYALRHIHRTVADAAKDRAAADSIMGHVDSSMRAVYVERIGDERLLAVTEHVRRWLLAGRPKSG